MLLFSLEVVSNSATPWTAARRGFLSFTISCSLLKFMSIESVMPSNHLILCLPFSCPQSFPASGSFPMKGGPCTRLNTDSKSKQDDWPDDTRKNWPCISNLIHLESVQLSISLSLPVLSLHVSSLLLSTLLASLLFTSLLKSFFKADKRQGERCGPGSVLGQGTEVPLQVIIGCGNPTATWDHPELGENLNSDLNYLWKYLGFGIMLL